MIGHVLLSLPDILAGRPAAAPDGAALLLVFAPAGRLAGAVAVVGELTLNTAVEVGLLAEAVVAHRSRQTGEDKTAQPESNCEIDG